MNEIKKDKALLCIGMVESGFKICLQLFLFVWTPLLEESIGGLIHPGSIFTCFMLCRLSGSELFEPLKKIIGNNLFSIVSLISSTIFVDFFLTYYINDFNFRLYMFIYFDGISGIYEPTISVLKSSLIHHKIRSTVMNLFRMPRNIFSIILLFVSKYFTTYQICLFIVVISMITFIFSLYGVYLMNKRQYSQLIKNIAVISSRNKNLFLNNNLFENEVKENEKGLLNEAIKIN